MRHLFIKISLVYFVALFCLPTLANSLPTAAKNALKAPELHPYRVIVKYKSALKPGRNLTHAPQTQEQLVAQMQQQTGLPVKHVMAMPMNTFTMTLQNISPQKRDQNSSGPPDIKQILQQLRADPRVEYAIADQKRHIYSLGHHDQWDEFPPPMGVNAERAWEITQGAPEIAVAVIDSGLNSHQDLTANVLPGFSFIHKSRDVHDENFHPHGTHVAGTIAANGLLKGIAPHTKIVPVQVINTDGYGWMSDIINGMYWAAGFHFPGWPDNENPVKVVNMSLGEFSPCTPPEQDAVTTLTQLGISVVVAAGNEGTSVFLSSPANCKGAISVAATNRHGIRASYSNYGDTVTIAAPGGDLTNMEEDGIVSTVSNDNYLYFVGTSMAAPHVAGVIALMLSVNPQLSPAQITELIRQTAAPFADSENSYYACHGFYGCGTGIIDAYAAVQAAAA